MTVSGTRKLTPQVFNTTSSSRLPSFSEPFPFKSENSICSPFSDETLGFSGRKAPWDWTACTTARCRRILALTILPHRYSRVPLSSLVPLLRANVQRRKDNILVLGLNDRKTRLLRLGPAHVPICARLVVPRSLGTERGGMSLRQATEYESEMGTLSRIFYRVCS